MADAAGRPMKYPYTMTSKLVQFPFKHYYNTHWGFRYWVFGIFVSMPLFYKIGKLCEYTVPPFSENSFNFFA